MKRRDLIRHLERHGCWLKREGGKHSIYVKKYKYSAVPRHREIEDHTAEKICKELGLPKPGKSKGRDD